MIRVSALVEAPDSRWLRKMVGELSLRNDWRDCQLEAASDPVEWEHRAMTFGEISIVICSISIAGALPCLKRVRARFPGALVIPLVTPSIPPSEYVHPAVLPFALLWKPLMGTENENILFQALAQVYSAVEKETDACFVVKTKSETWQFSYQDIYYFEARDKKVYIRTAEQELGFYETIAHLEQELPEYFIRCHKGYLINQRHIKRIDWTQRVIQMEAKTCVPLSRTYRSSIEEKISGAF